MCGRQPAIVTAREQPTAPPEQARELLDDPEPLRRSGTAAARDDDFRVGQRHASTGCRDAVDDADEYVRVRERWREAVHARRLAGEFVRGDGVRLHGEEFRASVQPCLLQEAPAPPRPRELHRVAGCRRDAVCSERNIELGSNVRHHLVATLGARCHDGDGLERCDELDEGLCNGGRRVRGERIVLSEVERLDAENVGRVSHRENVDRVVERPRECKRLRRELACLLDVDEDHDATPICLRTSTTAGAASGPSPRMTACFPCPSGTTSRVFSSSAGGRSGSARWIGLRCARSFAGTEG